MDKKKKVIILYALAGGGHISTARAIEENFLDLGVETQLVNVLGAFGPVGLKDPGIIYRFCLRYAPWLHQFYVWLLKQQICCDIFQALVWKGSEKNVANFITKFPADIYVATYPGINQVIGKFRKLNNLEARFKLITVVTDIATPHGMWFEKLADLTIVPSEEMKINGQKYTYDYSEKVEVLGQPISKKYFDNDTSQISEIELNPNSYKILICGGGEGGEKIQKMTQVIDSYCSGVEIIVACGKDEILFDDIVSEKYKNKVVALGWVNGLVNYQKWADLIISKAGPSSIVEALSLRKQLIIYDYVKGQENDNPSWTQTHGGYYMDNIYKIPELVTKLQVESKDKKNNIPEKYSEYFKTNWARRIAERILKFIA